MIFASLLMLIFALFGVFVFDAKTVFGILMTVCAAGVLINRLLLTKLIKNKYITTVISAALIAAFFACAVVPGPETESSSKKAKSVNLNPPFEVVSNETYQTPEEISEHLDAAAKYADAEDYDNALTEFSYIPEDAVLTEEDYILRSDVWMGKFGFEEGANKDFLDFLLVAVRNCPESRILNYRAGIVAYGLERYITAESYLARAFELAPADDPYVPYALAAVYKELGEDEYACAFMSLAEKNGILEDGEYDDEELVKWYKEYTAENGIEIK